MSRALREENSRTALTALAGLPSEDGSSSCSSEPHGDSSRTPQFIAAILATLGAFSAGSIMGWSSPALLQLQSASSPLPVTPEEGSWLGALVNLGALLGAAPAGVLAARVGRQRLLTFLSLPLLVSWLLVALGSSLHLLYLGRFLGGVCAGAVSVAAPTYTGEIAEQRCRGTLGALFQLQLTLGILFVYALGAVAPLRCLSLSCAIIPALYFVTFMWMPETPQFLLSQDRREAAERSLQWLRGPGCDVQKELLAMQSAVQEAQVNSLTWKDATGMLFRDKATRMALIIGFGLMFYQQLSGINVVIFYSGTIFESAGVALSPAYAALIIGVVQVVATLAAAMLVDRAGRKPLLMLSSTVMAVCLAGLATSYALPEDRPEWAQWAPLVCVALYITVFSLGFGPIPWLMMGELFSPASKSAACAVTASLNWLLAFLVTKGFQNLIDLLDNTAAFGFFACVCVCGAIFVATVVPETKGKSLERIQADLAGAKNNSPI